jgi:hypothetical protein
MGLLRGPNGAARRTSMGLLEQLGFIIKVLDIEEMENDQLQTIGAYIW